jgi:hypothetical protein
MVAHRGVRFDVLGVKADLGVMVPYSDEGDPSSCKRKTIFF